MAIGGVVTVKEPSTVQLLSTSKQVRIPLSQTMHRRSTSQHRLDVHDRRPQLPDVSVHFR
jgi:hypothetical protein